MNLPWPVPEDTKKAACHGGHCIEELLHKCLQKEVPLNPLAAVFFSLIINHREYVNTKEGATYKGKKIERSGKQRSPERGKVSQLDFIFYFVVIWSEGEWPPTSLSKKAPSP